MKLATLLLPIAALAAPFGAHAAEANDPGVHWSASVQDETNKQYAEALNEVRTYEQLGGDPFLGWEREGWLNYLAGSYAKSEQAYTRARQLQPTAINPLLGMLSVAQAQRDSKKIQQAAEDILRLEPTNYRAQLAMGSLYFSLKDYTHAASAYRRVLMTYPDDTEAMSGAAWATLYLGLRREASEYFRRLVSVSPAYPYAQRGFDLSMGKTPQTQIEASSR